MLQKGTLLIIGLSFLFITSCSQVVKKEGVSVILPENASKEEVCKLAVQVRPSYRQLDYQEREMVGFIHFGMNTFTEVEWGTGSEAPSLFNPTRLDAEQWIKTFKDAGITAVILVAKHHDGFCVWPTKYTAHSVASSPWREGKGDLVKEVADACKKYGIKLCIYLSPWDMHEPTYGTESYNDYYMHTMEELLTNYGPIYLLWLDGAGLNGSHGKTMKFDWNRIFSRARELQPDILLSGNAPDIRWVGNEKGKGRSTEWCVQGINETETYFGTLTGYKATAPNLGSIEDIMNKKRLVWYPSRGGLPLRKGWFYNKNDDNTVKSLTYLVNSYFSTVGQNSNLLPNLSPDATGLIPQKDAQRLIDFGNIIKEMKSVDYAQGATVQYSEEWITDDDVIHTNDGVSQASIVFDLKEKSHINVIKIQEDVEHYGQRVDSFAVDIEENNVWRTVAEGTTIGYRRLLRLEQPVEVSRLRVRFISSRVSLSFKSLSLYFLKEIEDDVNTQKTKMVKLPASKLQSENIQTSSLEALQNNLSGKYWEGQVNSSPACIVFETGTNSNIKNMVYLPCPEENSNHISNYSIWVSNDNKKWKKVIDNKLFGNIENNPVEQIIPLNIDKETKFIKFEILSLTSPNKKLKIGGLYLCE